MDEMESWKMKCGEINTNLVSHEHRRKTQLIDIEYFSCIPWVAFSKPCMLKAEAAPIYAVSERGAQGVLPMRVGSTTYQLDLQKNNMKNVVQIPKFL